jgi:SHOCT-like domain
MLPDVWLTLVGSILERAIYNHDPGTLSSKRDGQEQSSMLIDRAQEKDMTHQERTKILEMVAEGSLTVEQADQLLERLGVPGQISAEKQPDKSENASEFATFTKEQLAALAAYDVDEAYIHALREAGLRDLTVKQLISLKNYEVEANEIVALREAGLRDLTVKQLISLKTYEVEADEVRALREVGFTDLTVEHLIALKNYEVDAAYIRALREVGFTDLTVKQLMSLKNYEVEADEIKVMRAAGFTDLTVEQLIFLKEQGE